MVDRRHPETDHITTPGCPIGHASLATSKQCGESGCGNTTLSPRGEGAGVRTPGPLETSTQAEPVSHLPMDSVLPGLRTLLCLGQLASSIQREEEPVLSGWITHGWHGAEMRNADQNTRHQAYQVLRVGSTSLIWP